MKKNPFIEFLGVTSVPLLFTENGSVQFKDTLQYEFINLSNVPVLINNSLLLDRYYSGTIASPTIIAGTFNRWAPLMKSGERDTGQYTFVFQDSAYTGVTANHRLIVVKKMHSPAQVAGQY